MKKILINQQKKKKQLIMKISSPERVFFTIIDKTYSLNRILLPNTLLI